MGGQTCHIPERLVMPAQVQAGDVFNSAPWIKPASKRLWTFYGPDGLARNHYGFLEVMGYDDKPTEPFRPKLFRYKGKIYPGNRVHSTWPGLEVEGQEALAQPRMGGYRPAIDDRFLLSRVILDASLRLSSRHRVFLGEELDLRAVWRARPRLELMAGTSFFWAGPFLIATGRARDARWQMLQATWSW
jgi:hypothetical protein